MTLSTLLFLALCLSATHAYPEPQPLVGDALPAGAVTRLGPQAFRYAGHVGPMGVGGPAVRYSADGKRVDTRVAPEPAVLDRQGRRRDAGRHLLERPVAQLAIRRRPDLAEEGAVTVTQKQGRLRGRQPGSPDPQHDDGEDERSRQCLHD